MSSCLLDRSQSVISERLDRASLILHWTSRQDFGAYVILLSALESRPKKVVSPNRPDRDGGVGVATRPAIRSQKSPRSVIFDWYRQSGRFQRLETVPI